MKLSYLSVVASLAVLSVAATAGESWAKSRRGSSNRGAASSAQSFSTRGGAANRNRHVHRSFPNRDSSVNRNLSQRTRNVPRFVPRGNQTRVGNVTPITGRGKATLKPEGISQLKNQILRKPLNPNLVKQDKIKILPHPGFKNGKGHKHGHKWWLGHPLLIKHKWCGYYPIYCHWWYDICTPIRYCAPVHCVHYTYDYVHCGGGFWYLGLKGTLLPGKGVGIQSVETASPAALAGLKPGMVITRTNDVQLVDNQSMPNAIANSNGVLNLAVLSKADGKPTNVRVAMRRIAANGF